MVQIWKILPQYILVTPLLYNIILLIFLVLALFSLVVYQYETQKPNFSRAVVRYCNVHWTWVTQQQHTLHVFMPWTCGWGALCWRGESHAVMRIQITIIFVVKIGWIKICFKDAMMFLLMIRSRKQPAWQRIIVRHCFRIPTRLSSSCLRTPGCPCLPSVCKTLLELFVNISSFISV